MLVLVCCISLVSCMTHGLLRMLLTALLATAGANVRWRTTEMAFHIFHVIVSVVPSHIAYACQACTNTAAMLVSSTQSNRVTVVV